MTAHSAQVYVTKLAAARRLLRTAIRLHFDGEDALAVHVVAAAAYGVLRDLWTAKGGSEAARVSEIFVLGLLSLAKLKTRGELPSEFSADDHLMETLDRLIERFQLQPDSDLSSLEHAVSMDQSSTKAFWNESNRVSNFLKHADSRFAARDEQVALALDQVDNVTLLLRATDSYESLAPDDLGFEGAILQIWFLASHGRGEAYVGHPFREQIEHMERIPEGERREFCAFQLRRPRPDGL